MPGGAARGKRPCAGGEGGRLAEGTPLLQYGQVCACQGIPLCRTRFCRLTHLQKVPVRSADQVQLLIVPWKPMKTSCELLYSSTKRSNTSILRVKKSAVQTGSD